MRKKVWGKGHGDREKRTELERNRSDNTPLEVWSLDLGLWAGKSLNPSIPELCGHFQMF